MLKSFQEGDEKLIFIIAHENNVTSPPPECSSFSLQFTNETLKPTCPVVFTNISDSETTQEIHENVDKFLISRLGGSEVNTTILSLQIEVLFIQNKYN